MVQGLKWGPFGLGAIVLSVLTLGVYLWLDRRSDLALPRLSGREQALSECIPPTLVGPRRVGDRRDWSSASFEGQHLAQAETGPFVSTLTYVELSWLMELSSEFGPMVEALIDNSDLGNILRVDPSWTLCFDTGLYSSRRKEFVLWSILVAAELSRREGNIEDFSSALKIAAVYSLSELNYGGCNLAHAEWALMALVFGVGAYVESTFDQVDVRTRQALSDLILRSLPGEKRVEQWHWTLYGEVEPMVFNLALYAERGGDPDRSVEFGFDLQVSEREFHNSFRPEQTLRWVYEELRDAVGVDSPTVERRSHPRNVVGLAILDCLRVGDRSRWVRTALKELETLAETLLEGTADDGESSR